MRPVGTVECTVCGRPHEDGGSRFCPYCGNAGANPRGAADPLLGAVLEGRYRVESFLGQGGMGRVYRARHLTLDRPVVLKLLHRSFSGDPLLAQRFQREARAASRLNHPNSIAVLDFGEAADGTLFMAMEYLPGRDLGRLLAEEFPLGEARIVRMGAQVLAALAEAHAQGVIHRDLKPENIMVERRRDAPDFVKVLDFGLAKIVSAEKGEPRLTRTGLVCGTPEYMSPEQARGGELDPRSDLYSMAVLLYQLATGALPFQADTPVGFLTAHVSSVAVPPRRRRPDLAISAALEAVIMRGLAKDPARRYRTADQMRAALLACAPGKRPGVALATPEVRPPGRSRRPFWAFAAAMVVALLGGLAMVALVKRTPADQRNFAEERREEPKTAERPSPEQADGQKKEELPSRASLPEASPPEPAAGQSEEVDTPSRQENPPSPRPAAGRESEGVPSPARPPRRPWPGPAAGQESEETPSAGRPSWAGSAEGQRGLRGQRRAAALYRFADERRARQDIDGAIRLYQAALAADPGIVEAHKKLALCYEEKGEPRRAAAEYRRYLSTDPPDADRVRAALEGLE